MKFSIITPSFRQGQYIRQNIESVLQQGWTEFEHVVVDGGSLDETVSVLESYPHLKWISEKDEGQADALNKGLRMVSGDVVGWINSDDYYFGDTFTKVAAVFRDPEVMWVIGDISLYEEESGRFIRMSSPVVTWENLKKNPDIVRQQGVFIRKSFLDEAGGWNKGFFMVMDFDLWVRLAKRSNPVMLAEQLAVFRIQRDQKTGLSNLRRQMREMLFVLKREGAEPHHLLRVRLKKELHWAKGMIKSFLVRVGVLDRRFLMRPLRGWNGR